MCMDFVVARFYSCRSSYFISGDMCTYVRVFISHIHTSAQRVSLLPQVIKLAAYIDVYLRY